MTRRALFLDRDGVINVERGYVSARDDFQFVDGIFDLCAHATAAGYLLVVITNQAGIGRGYYSEQAFADLTTWMCEEFRKRGTPLARVYHCPFHPEHGVGEYRRESDWRKPGPGMIVQAATDFDLDLAGSVLVGDRGTDIEAGVAAGVGCNLFFVPDASAAVDVTPSNASGVVTRLSEVTAYLSREPAELSR